jgi:sugar phosphate isomerase/epimerase
MPDIGRRLLATCWTHAGNARPGRGDGASPVTLRERIEATAAAGWDGIGLPVVDLERARATSSWPEIRALIDANGIAQVELEFLGDWWTEGERRAASDATRRFLLDAAEALGANAIKVGGDRLGEHVDPDRFRAEFDVLATQARDAGTRVALEAMPMSELSTTRAAAAVVRDVGNPGGGLCVDLWHARRAGATDQELRECITIADLVVVEVEDAAAEVVGSMWDDSCDRRMNPGEGDLDAPGFIATMHELGWRGMWGVEMIAEAHRALPVGEALTRTRTAMLGAIDAAEALL